MESQHRYDPLLMSHILIRLELDQHFLVVFHCPLSALFVAINPDQFLDPSIRQGEIGLQLINRNSPPDILTRQLPAIKCIARQRPLRDGCAQNTKSQDGRESIKSQSPNERNGGLGA